MTKLAKSVGRSQGRRCYRYHPVTIMAIDERLSALEADVTKLEDHVARLEARVSSPLP